MTRCRIVIAIGVALAATTPALAQTVGPRGPIARPVLRTSPAGTSATVASSDGSAYERLSVGHRQIARAIFEAQHGDIPDVLTLEQIAASKPSGRGGWVRLYEDMYARGLVTEKTLGEALTRYRRQQWTSREETTVAAHAAGAGGHRK
jgi:hypothetical protein